MKSKSDGLVFAWLFEHRKRINFFRLDWKLKGETPPGDAVARFRRLMKNRLAYFGRADHRLN